jgi:hypothetical protein
MAETIANDVGALRAVSQMLKKYAVTSDDQDQRNVLLAAMQTLEMRILRELERPLPQRNLNTVDVRL